MRDVSFLLRPAHNEQVAKILSDPEASQNDKGVAWRSCVMPRSAAQFDLPVLSGYRHRHRGSQERSAGLDRRQGRGVALKGHLQDLHRGEPTLFATVALDMYEEINTGTNLPAQIDILATDGDYYKFVFMAKGVVRPIRPCSIRKPRPPDTGQALQVSG